MESLIGYSRTCASWMERDLVNAVGPGNDLIIDGGRSTSPSMRSQRLVLALPPAPRPAVLAPVQPGAS